MGGDHRQRRIIKIMAKEKSNVKATESTKKLYLERELFTTKDGKDYWGYSVKGRFAGRDIKVDFVASDQGGYEVLDMLFALSEDDVEVVMRDEVMTDDSGRETAYTVYEAQIIDDDGNKFAYKIKPSRNSDKTLLQFLLIELNKKANGGDGEVA